LVEQERVRVDGSLGPRVPAQRVVGELDRALLGDRDLELAQLRRHPGRGVVEVVHLDAGGCACRRLVGAGTAKREVLQREAERLRVSELSIEQGKRSLKRGQLLVPELDRGEKVALGAERVELLTGELVPL